MSFIVSRPCLLLIGLPLLVAGCEPAAMARYRHARFEMPRSLRHVMLYIERARGDVHRRIAELDRAVGRIAGGAR